MRQTILLVEDDAANAEAIRTALVDARDEAFRVEWVRTRAAALERLAKSAAPDGGQQTVLHALAITAVLVDLFLPDSQGIETCDWLLRVAPLVPILILCEPGDEASAKLAVQRGSQDYLFKDRLDPYFLPKTVHSMIARAAAAEQLFEVRERAQVTLDSIGDAVISTDLGARVTYLNKVAETLTGWPLAEAIGRPIEDVQHILNALTRAVVLNPMVTAMRSNRTAELGANCLLVQRGGAEIAIEDSAAPIHHRHGQVIGAVMVFRDVSAARKLSASMSHLAQHDSLTNLPNRVLLNERLTHAIARAQRQQTKLGVLFLDVDRFKHTNDSLGHGMGDRLLQSIARRLLTCVRSTDTVCRQSGDEFVILLQEVGEIADASACAEKILHTLSTPHRIDNLDLRVTASIGVVTYPNDGLDAETLLKHADFAMYYAKEKGRNNFQLFKPDLNTRATERQGLENGLRDALDRREFVLRYQPKVSLRTGAIVGVEALIRWMHPERGVILPECFIPVAEESGFIVPIGRWVLGEACRQAREWQDAGLPPLRIAINISPLELRSPDFVDSVRATLHETRLDPQYLELELTETFLLQDSKSTAAVLQALRAMGVHLALDDFGTGYSSLSHLKRFPIDTLKIDRSFVRDLATDSDDASIVGAVISMGNSLNLLVVAEGVETAEQVSFLRERQCAEAQGDYLSRPLEAQAFTRLLDRGIRSTNLPLRLRCGEASFVPPVSV